MTPSIEIEPPPSPEVQLQQSKNDKKKSESKQRKAKRSKKPQKSKSKPKSKPRKGAREKRGRQAVANSPAAGKNGDNQKIFEVQCRLCEQWVWEIVGEEQVQVAQELQQCLVCSGCVKTWIKWTFTSPLTPAKVKEGGFLWANIRRDDGSVWNCMFLSIFFSDPTV